MIKFFRHIRQRMIKENRVSKYLLYAIGEIVLVVIGILIALQINTLNEQRKDRIKEQVVLKNLLEDYQSNLSQLEIKMAMRNAMLASGAKILYAIDHPDSVDRDSLIYDLGVAIDWPTFVPIENDLISSGNLRLIQNEDLKRLLSNWSADIVSLQEIETAWAGIIFNHFEPAVLQWGITRDVTSSWMNDSNQLWLLDNIPNATGMTLGNSIDPVSTTELLESRELEGMIAWLFSYNKPANLQSAALLKRINKILSLIEEEINQGP